MQNEGWPDTGHNLTSAHATVVLASIPDSAYVLGHGPDDVLKTSFPVLSPSSQHGQVLLMSHPRCRERPRPLHRQKTAAEPGTAHDAPRTTKKSRHTAWTQAMTQPETLCLTQA